MVGWEGGSDLVIRRCLPWGVGEEWRGGGSAVQLLLCLGRCGHHCWGRVLHLRLADAS